MKIKFKNDTVILEKGKRKSITKGQEYESDNNQYCQQLVDGGYASLIASKESKAKKVKEEVEDEEGTEEEIEEKAVEKAPKNKSLFAKLTK